MSASNTNTDADGRQEPELEQSGAESALDDSLMEENGEEWCVIQDPEHEGAWIRGKVGTAAHAPFTGPEGHIVRYDRHEGTEDVYR